MTRRVRPLKEFYTEVEAADALNVTLSRLHSLLDEHIFNEGTPRPQELTFYESDLILLSFWNKSTQNSRVIRMPRR